MVRSRRTTVLLLLTCILFVSGAALFGETLPRIGVIDLSRIYENYFQESSAYREIDERTQEYNEEVAVVKEEIDDLEDEMLEAQKEGDNVLQVQLQDEIEQKQRYLKEYHSYMSNRINGLKQDLWNASGMSSEIMREIEYVAQAEGFTLIFRKSDPNLLWFNEEVDITELVLQRLSDN